MTRWFEEIELSTIYDLGSHTFTEAEIVRFATLYDPQYFHTDPDAARHSHFGGLVASGWHTVSVGHRLMVDRLTAEEDIVRTEGSEPGVAGPSPGVNRMDFSAPVRPGDTVRFTLSVTNKRKSNSIPGWGLLFNLIEAHNQHGNLVYSADLVSFSKLRDFRPSLRLRAAMALSRLPVFNKLMVRK